MRPNLPNTRLIPAHRITVHLRPLALAANITQATFCRLDQVLLTFGHLYMIFYQLHEPVDRPAQKAVLESLEKRWAASDQDIFIAAVYLNPFIKNVPFNSTLERFVPIQKVQLLEGLYNRFLPNHPIPQHEIWSNLMDYEGDKGVYRLLSTSIPKIRSAAEFRVSTTTMNLF